MFEHIIVALWHDGYSSIRAAAPYARSLPHREPISILFGCTVVSSLVQFGVPISGIERTEQDERTKSNGINEDSSNVGRHASLEDVLEQESRIVVKTKK